ncbi:radical SAM protein [Nanoarchaeota archaeon]
MKRNDLFIKSPIVLWNLTNECNLNCSYCYQDAGKCKGYELSLDKKLSLVDEFSEAGVWAMSFGGGEPLLRKRELYNIAKYASNKGISSYVMTNGTLLDKGTVRELKENGVERVSISLDTAKKEIHDYYSGKKGSWKKALEGILNSKEGNLNIKISATITQRNFSELENYFQLGKYLGVDEIDFTAVLPMGRGRNIADECLNPEQMKSALRLAAKYSLNGSNVVMSTNPEFVPYLRDCLEEKEKSKPPNYSNLDCGIGCMAGVGWCAIQPDGLVTPCVLMPDLVVGDVKKESFSEIWTNSPLFNKLRDRDNLKGNCGGCKNKSSCGGCRARAYALTNDPLEGDYSCEVYNSE